MKSKYLLYASLPVMALGLMAASSASAHGFMSNLTPEQIVERHQTMFAEQAKLLGVSVDEVKAAWASGKTLLQLAEEKGITKDQLKQKMKDARMTQMKSHLQALVDKGIITQAQADSRLQAMQNFEGKGKHGMGRGFKGLGF